jgi:protein-disulfide isomerase
VTAAAEQKEEVVAILNEQPIYRSEVEAKIAFKLYRLRGSIYRLMQREIEAIVDQRLLEAQAARENLSVAELIQKEVNAKVKQPTMPEVSAYIAEHPKEGIDAKQRGIRARTYLHQRALLQRKLDYLAELRAGADYKLMLTQPPMPRMNVETKGQPWRGARSAPVTLVHFADFASRLSSQSAENIQKAMQEFPDQIRWVHRSFINRVDEIALAAAQVGEKAYELGKFWQYHDAIFKLNGSVELEDIERLTEDLELKTKDAKDLQNEARYFLNIKKDLDEARRMGIKAAPVIFVNGLYFSGTFSYEQLRSLSQAELDEDKKSDGGAQTP